MGVWNGEGGWGGNVSSEHGTVVELIRNSLPRDMHPNMTQPAGVLFFFKPEERKEEGGRVGPRTVTAAIPPPLNSSTP